MSFYIGVDILLKKGRGFEHLWHYERAGEYLRENRRPKMIFTGLINLFGGECIWILKAGAEEEKSRGLEFIGGSFALNAEPLDWRGPLKAEIYIEKGTLDFFASVDPIEHRKDGGMS